MEREKNRRSICGSRQRYSRRQFIARAAMAGIVTGSPRSQAPAATETSRNSLPDATSNNAALDGLRKAFLAPSQSAKPLTRWFWFGGAMTREEITRELTFMQEAVIGGVELQPVYPLEVDDPERNIRNVRYFSREWFDLLRHTAKEAQRLGLQFDLTLGSGWPYGGPFIPENLAARRLRVLTTHFGGPGELFWDLSPQITWEFGVEKVLAAPLLPTGQLDLHKVENLSQQVKPVLKLSGGVFGYEVRWTAPEGLWLIMAFLNSPNHMLVKRPSLGMEGYVVDHLRPWRCS
jgi:alpha-L-rhamnosidase